MKHKAFIAALGLCLLALTVPAAAQLSALGPTFSVWSATSRGSAVAYDPRNHVYLVVNGHGLVYGRFVNADGVLAGEPFLMQAAPAFGQFPQVAYSPDAHGGNGGFLVTWHESDGPAPSIHTRMVSYAAGFLTPDRVLIGNDTYHEIMGAPVAYSTVSREFLVVWRQYSDVNIFGIRLNANGDPISGAIPVAAGPLFESDPSLTYNPATDEFLTVYRLGFGPTSVMAQRVKAGSGALVAPPTIVAQAATVNTTGVTYNPVMGRYTVAWHQMPGDFINGRTLGHDAVPIGPVTAISARVGTYDSLSLDANDLTGSILVVGHDKLSVEVGGVEIDGGGNPFTAGGAITGSGGNGNHVPKVASSNARREWLVVASRNFAQTIAQRLQTATPGGGQPPPPPPTPPPPPPPPPPAPSQPRMFIDYPANGSVVQNSFGVAGWALDLSAQGGSGVAAVHVWAFNHAGGNPVFLGSANLNQPRPDISNHYSNAQFSSSGYGLSAQLPAGAWLIRVSMLSAVAGTFNLMSETNVTVLAPVSLPRMYVDGPAPYQDITTIFHVAGWAVDIAAPEGTGVDGVHVWAYPTAGGAPVWVGAAQLGIQRLDVSGTFGHHRFSAGGYFLQGTLPRGSYQLVVFAHSTVTGTFNQSVVVPVTIR